MNILIDNLDGRGAVDYTSAVSADGPITLQRELNKPTLCAATILAELDGLTLPRKRARVTVTDGDANLLFTGYLANTPVREYVGEATKGAVYTVRLSAISSAAEPATTGLGAVHTLADADGALALDKLSLTEVRELATDVTLSGELEPASLVQEHFIGDGTTNVFTLASAAFRTNDRLLAQDRFTGATLDRVRWAVADPGSALSITADGLTVSGGSGADGDTTVLTPATVEMSGALVAELTGVVFNDLSAGMLAGFYSGTPVLAACLAGFRVRSTSGANVLVPVVNGVEAGSTFAPTTGHKYTLRVRVFCRELQRIPAQYSVVVDGAVQTFGSATPVDAPMDFVFELRDEGLASNTPVTVLYDSVAAGAPLASSPALCRFAVVNAETMSCAVGAVNLNRTGSLSVTSLLPSGAAITRLVGLPNQGVDCEATYGTSTGATATLTFFDGRVPVAGERIIASYREISRSVARLADAAAIADEASAALPGAARWQGKVLERAARSSSDCEAAAAALLALSGSNTRACTGTFTAVNLANDVQPGDVLRLNSDGITSAFVVRGVEVTDGASVPEARHYRVYLDNTLSVELADGLGLRVSDGAADDALLPLTASSGAAATLADLPALTVTSLSETSLGIDTGTPPPTGGGFEIRRRDNGFGPSTTDLITRSLVRSFTLPRSAQNERFAVRMYDASTPPLYSRWATALVIHAPVA